MALAALTAGVDLLLDIKEAVPVVDFLCECVATGRLAEARVDEAFERVWVIKQRSLASGPIRAAATGDVRQDSIELAKRVARDAIEVSSGASPALPLDPSKPVTAILLKPFETPIDPPEQPLAAALRERFGDVEYAQLGPKSDAVVYEEAVKLARGAEQLVLAMIVRPAAWHAFGLRPEQKEFVQQILSERGDVVLASLGVPYALRDYPEAGTRICTYSDVAVSQQALAEFLSTSPAP